MNNTKFSSASTLPVGEPESRVSDASSIGCSCRVFLRVLRCTQIVAISDWGGPNGLAGVKMDSNSERTSIGADGSSSSWGDGSSIEQNSAEFISSKSGSSANASLGINNGYVVT